MLSPLFDAASYGEMKIVNVRRLIVPCMHQQQERHDVQQ